MDFETLVAQERIRQEEKWGEQNHEPSLWLAILMEEVGEAASSILCNKWGTAKHRNKEFPKELVQVAAVCQAIYECGIRNEWF